MFLDAAVSRGSRRFLCTRSMRLLASNASVANAATKPRKRCEKSILQARHACANERTERHPVFRLGRIPVLSLAIQGKRADDRRSCFKRLLLDRGQTAWFSLLPETVPLSDYLVTRESALLKITSNWKMHSHCWPLSRVPRVALGLIDGIRQGWRFENLKSRGSALSLILTAAARFLDARRATSLTFSSGERIRGRPVPVIFTCHRFLLTVFEDHREESGA